MNRSTLVALALLSIGLSSCGGGGAGEGGGTGIPGAPAGPFAPGVAYLADAEVDGRVELYVASLDGTEQRKASIPLPAAGDVVAFAWSPDRSRLLYTVDEDGDAYSDALWAVGADATGNLRLSTPLAAGSFVSDFRWSFDSQWVAFVVGEPAPGAGLWTVSAQGGTPVRVSPADRRVLYIAWSPGSTRLAYDAVVLSEPATRLFVVDPSGANAVDLGFEQGFSWSPDGSRVSLVAFDPATSVRTLVVSSPAGGSPTPLSGPLSDVPSWVWSPDSSYLAFQTRSADITFPLSLWSERDGVVAVSDLALGTYPPVWSPDSAHLAFVAADEDPLLNPDTAFGIATADSAAGVTTVTSDWFYPPNDVSWLDAGRVLFHVFGGPHGAVESARADGSDAAFLLDAASPVGSPDGAHVACRVYDDAGTAETFVTESDTSYGAHRISIPVYPPLVVGECVWTPDSTRVVYRATPEGVDVVELFASTLDGHTHTRLSAPMVRGGQVRGFELR